MAIKVTVGIPVYNVEKYIEMCVRSVLEQTLDEIEILVVDDKCSDGSIGIIERLAETHPRGSEIRILKHEKNMGVAHSRNTIIENCRGKYLYLIDSDDYIVPEALEILYTKAEQTNAETVWGSMKEYHSDTGEEKIYRQYPDLELMGENELVMYECRNLKETLQHSVCNILFLFSFLQHHHLRFEEYGGYDDTLFHAVMQPLVKRAILMSTFTYMYYKRLNSISQFNYRDSFSIKEAFDAIGASERIISECRKMKGRPFFDVRCAKVMKQALFMICGVLKHRNQMTDGVVKDQRLKEWFQHPATLGEIWSFRRYKVINFLFWLIGRLPSWAMVYSLTMIGKKKGYL